MSELLRFLPRKAEAGGGGMDARLSRAEGGILQSTNKDFWDKGLKKGQIISDGHHFAKEANPKTRWDKKVKANFAHLSKKQKD